VTTADELSDFHTRPDPERLEVARELVREPGRVRHARLRQLVSAERVPLVARVLAEAAEAAALLETDHDSEDSLAEDSALKSIYDRAYRDATSSLLHEIADVAGRANDAVKQELPLESRARREIELLVRLLKAFRQMARASAPAEPREFDLGELLVNLAQFTGQSLVELQSAGTTPFIAVGDPDLITLATRNLLSNAVEATLDLGDEVAKARPVTINWGAGRGHYWISVIDRGIGWPGDSALREKGRSTKTNHPGYGLAAVDRAAESFGGVFDIGSEDGRTTATLSWSKP